MRLPLADRWRGPSVDQRSGKKNTDFLLDRWSTEGHGPLSTNGRAKIREIVARPLVDRWRGPSVDQRSGKKIAEMLLNRWSADARGHVWQTTGIPPGGTSQAMCRQGGWDSPTTRGPRGPRKAPQASPITKTPHKCHVNVDSGPQKAPTKKPHKWPAQQNKPSNTIVRSRPSNKNECDMNITSSAGSPAKPPTETKARHRWHTFCSGLRNALDNKQTPVKIRPTTESQRTKQPSPKTCLPA